VGEDALARHLIAAAESRRAALLAEAQAEAEMARAEEEGMAEGARETARERAVRTGRARVEARRIAALARAALVEAILARLAERLRRLPAEPRYPGIAERLCREILPEAPAEGAVVRGDAESAAAYRRLARGAPARFEPLPEAEAGGLELSDAGGTFRIRNTLASRLRKARPTLVESLGLSLGSPDG
jgi:vacuolar-type H+-ATPase subunit E/Vma4